MQFDFGRNWADFARSVDEAHVARAVTSLQRLVDRHHLAGKTMLDIGSGSGLSALAALRLGARRVFAVDLDPNSVETTRSLLGRFAPGENWEAVPLSVFDLDRGAWPLFDVVHSWGVLHHTGNLSKALRIAADRVAPGGVLAIALYRRTRLDRFWSWEKRFYAAAPAASRRVIRAVFKGAYLAGLAARGRAPRDYIRNYGGERGMSWSHDVDDWLGGYPYEPIDAGEVQRELESAGLVLDLVIERPVRAQGLFGAPCNEYRFLRPA